MPGSPGLGFTPAQNKGELGIGLENVKGFKERESGSLIQSLYLKVHRLEGYMAGILKAVLMP